MVYKQQENCNFSVIVKHESSVLFCNHQQFHRLNFLYSVWSSIDLTHLCFCLSQVLFIAVFLYISFSVSERDGGDDGDEDDDDIYDTPRPLYENLPACRLDDISTSDLDDDDDPIYDVPAMLTRNGLVPTGFKFSTACFPTAMQNLTPE